MKPLHHRARFAFPADSFAPARMALVAVLACWLTACGPSAAQAPAPASGDDALSAVCGDHATPAWAIQGDGDATPLAGRAVMVEGVVVGDYEGPAPALRGFYLQDVAGDGDPATSDAVFVFNGNRDQVRTGDVVRVRGTAAEFEGQTQVSSSGSLTICGRGTVKPIDVALPFPSLDWPERFEGMLVRFTQTLHVTDHYGLGRFGEVTVSSGGRLPQPTEIAEPGAAARAVQQANDRNRIVVDDAWNDQNRDPIVFGRGGDPLTARNTLRGGDRLTGLTGVMTWTWAGNSASDKTWRVRPIHALAGSATFTAANERRAAPAVGGSTRVGSFNVLNYFNTFDACTAGDRGVATDCRGATGAEAFERQWRKTVAAIAGMNVDILGVIELENDGYGPASAIAHLVERLNAVAAGARSAATPAGTARWSFVDVDAATGTRNALGTDAIKVGFLYRADRVRPVGTTAVLATRAFLTGGDSGPRNRPSLAQAFETATGARVVVNINHLKSKGSPCDRPDTGDGQANCSDVRTAAAGELVAWLATDPTRTGDPDILLLGDLNAYAHEDPVRAVTAAGYTDLLDGDVAEPYTYVFAGQWGRLDHALASPALVRQARGAAVWHINADEPPVLGYGTAFKTGQQQATLYEPDPYRSSDHDPVVVGLELEQ